MKNLKVGDVVKYMEIHKHTVLAVLNQTVLLSESNHPEEVMNWYHLNELKDYTLVQPEKTLEEKFLEWRETDGFLLPLDELLKDLAQIAEEHYKDKQD